MSTTAGQTLKDAAASGGDTWTVVTQDDMHPRVTVTGVMSAPDTVAPSPDIVSDGDVDDDTRTQEVSAGTSACQCQSEPLSWPDEATELEGLRNGYTQLLSLFR